MVDTKRIALLKQIQMCDFVTFETALFLDTHKTDKDALAYFNKHKAHAEEYRAEYVSKYGPLTIKDNGISNDKTWSWVETPWPWEFEGEK